MHASGHRFSTIDAEGSTLLAAQEASPKHQVRLRVIPRLDVKGPNLVKGVHLEGLRVLGPPETFARWYYRSGADELLYIDVVASLYGRNSLLDMIRRTAEDVFIPVTVGGGIRSVEDARLALRAGADKVAINTAAVRDPELISRIADAFGSSTVVLSIAAIRRPTGEWEAYTDAGREHSGRDVVEWAAEGADRGAGEILVTSIDRDGTGEGLDLELIESVCAVVDVPVVCCGGIGRAEHVRAAVMPGGVTGIAVASALHYRAVMDGLVDGSESAEEGNRDFIRSGARNTRIQGCRIEDIKAELREAGAWARPSGCSS